MRLYIIRHAEPDYANDTITPAGHAEAQALAERLAAEGINRIFCSPLGRARATMQYTADRLGLSATIEEWTRELDFGAPIDDPCLGKVAAWDISPELILREEHSDTANRFPHPLFEGIPLQERITAIRAASDDFLARLGYRREGGIYHGIAPNTDKVAVFCHGGFGITWLSLLLQIPVTLGWVGWWLPPSSVTTVLFEGRAPDIYTPRCMGMSDVSHLYHAGLPVRPWGITRNFH